MSEPVTPIMVRPAVSKLMVTATGRSQAALAPRTAASASLRSLMVSIHNRSAPPSASPRACSAKASSHAWADTAPRGSSSSPVGPIDPATSMARPVPSAAALALAAAGL